MSKAEQTSDLRWHIPSVDQNFKLPWYTPRADQNFNLPVTYIFQNVVLPNVSVFDEGKQSPLKQPSLESLTDV